MTLQSSPSLLTWWSAGAGLQVDSHRRPHAASMNLGDSFLATRQDLGSKQLEPSSPSSSIDINRCSPLDAFQEFSRDSGSALDDKDLTQTRPRHLFYMLTQKLRPLADRNSKDYKPQQDRLLSTSQVTLLKHDDSPSLVSRPPVHRKPVRGLHSYGPGEDRINAPNFSKPISPSTESPSGLSNANQQPPSDKHFEAIPYEPVKRAQQPEPLNTDESDATLKDPSNATTQRQWKDFESQIQVETVHHRATWRYKTEEQGQLSFEENEVFTIPTKLQDGKHRPDFMSVRS